MSNPAQPESIGPLIFEPNANYPYPFDVSPPPRFWMEETSGALSDAVEACMGGEKLTPEQRELMRLYLTQYLERAVLTGDANRERMITQVAQLRTTKDFIEFAEYLSEYGAEVF